MVDNNKNEENIIVIMNDVTIRDTLFNKFCTSIYSKSGENRPEKSPKPNHQCRKNDLISK